MLLRKILKMEPLRLAKNAFPPGGGGFLYGKIVGVLVVSFRFSKFQFLVSLRGCFFVSSSKPIMVSFMVPNFHDLIKR